MVRETDFTSDEVIQSWENTRDKFLEIVEKDRPDLYFIFQELLDDKVIVTKKKSIEEYFRDKNI